MVLISATNSFYSHEKLQDEEFKKQEESGQLQSIERLLKFDYSKISQHITKDIQSYLYFNNQVDVVEKTQKAFNIEKTKLKAHTLVSLKEKFPNTLVTYLKKKIILAYAS